MKEWKRNQVIMLKIAFKCKSGFRKPTFFLKKLLFKSCIINAVLYSLQGYHATMIHFGPGLTFNY